MGPLAILLSTFNGERYVDRQLATLFSQDAPDWTLLVRDDGSSDGTVDILDRWARREARLVRIDDGDGNLGPVGSFGRLLEHARSSFAYAMFCDQDDEWTDQRVSRSLACMREAECEHPGEPVLVHSDLVVVDDAGRVLSPSYWSYSGMDPALNDFNRLLFQNTVTGCTATLNGPLLSLLDRIPFDAAMHDWWTALVASAFGRIRAMPLSTVRYRQHSGNVLGARRGRLPFASVAGLLARPASLWRQRRAELIEQPLRQATAFLERFADRLPESRRSLLGQLARWRHMSTVERKLVLLRGGCLRQRLDHNVSMLLLA